MSEKPSVTLTGMVEKVVKSPLSSEPDQAQIAIEGADHQYEAILIENTLTDKSGNEVQLRPGAEVKVTVEAEPEATTAKDEKGPNVRWPSHPKSIRTVSKSVPNRRNRFDCRLEQPMRKGLCKTLTTLVLVLFAPKARLLHNLRESNFRNKMTLPSIILIKQ